MLEILLSLVLGVHLLLVDVAMFGPLMAVWLRWRSSRLRSAEVNETSSLDQLARRVACWSLAAAVTGVILGVVALLLVPHAESGAYNQAIAKLPAARWWFVAGEVVFYLVTLGAYLLLWRALQRRPVVHSLLAIVAATDLIYHFPRCSRWSPASALQPKLLELLLDHALHWRLLLDPDTLSRVVHYWLAAWAVSASATMVLASRCLRMQTTPELATSSDVRASDDSPAAKTKNSALADVRRRAARIALAVSLVQLPVGVWVVCELPGVVQTQLLGEDALATILFDSSIVLALGLLHHLAMIALGESRHAAAVRAGALMVATVLLMVAALHRARHQAFGQQSPLPALPGAPKNST